MMRFDPFREIDRLTQPMWNARASVPLDVYRKGEKFIVRVDLPGIDPASLDLTIERNVLSIKAERTWAPQDGDEVLVAERPQGSFTRRLFLSEGLDADNITASYEYGVLTVTVPVADSAKSRKIEVGLSSNDDSVLNVSASQS
ncbi:MAG: Hsp20/alpha crystallin family protein [Acidimicrobiales bacterium]